MNENILEDNFFIVSNIFNCILHSVCSYLYYSKPLEYTIFDKKNIKSSVFEVTFNDLRQSKVGDMFYANPNPSDKKYMNEVAEVLFVDGRSAMVRVTEIIKDGRIESSETHLVHVDLF